MLLLVLAGALAGGGGARADVTVVDACVDVVDDPRGDVRSTSGPVEEHAAPMDITRAALAIAGDRFTVTLALNASPRDVTERSYRYWPGFHASRDGGEPQLVEFQIAGTLDYDEARLTGPHAMGSPAWATVPVAWNGSVATVAYNLSDLARHMGASSVLVGGVTSASDGAHLTTRAQSAVTASPYAQDWTTTALVPAMLSCRAADEDAGARSRPLPAPPVAGVAAALALAAVVVSTCSAPRRPRA